jgi:predicted aldo/keto reductase-like oxidoreductase
VLILNYRQLGNTKEEVSILGFGCMRFPTTDDDQIDREKSFEMLKYGIDHGVNYLDTAWPYHGGDSEGFVGDFLQQYDLREDIYLATKLPSWLIESYDDMEKYLDKQLKRLKTDHIDFYLLHSLNKKSWKNLKDNNVFQFIEEMKAKGKIKHIGFSFHDDLKTFKTIVDDYDHWDFCQIQLNYLDEEEQAGLEGMHYARERGLGIIIMEPLRGGNLVGRAPADVMALWEQAEQKRSLPEWGLKYLYNKPAVDIVLSGMSHLDHVKENIKISDEATVGCLTAAEEQLIDEVKKTYLERIQVNCTDCKYCMPCPHGVNIPRTLRFYNEAHMFDDFETPTQAYLDSVDEDNRAHQCIDCGICLDKCPQKIQIPDFLKKAEGLYKGE